jgi:ribulose-bisphosphate carboxylase large chain
VERKYAAKVLTVDKKKKIVEIGIPEDDFEPGNIPQFLSVVAGNVFGLKQIDALKLLDIELTKEFVASYEGPRFGIEGMRALTAVYDRPLIGTIVKPKVGLPPDEYSKVVYEAAMGGVDLVKMDETLTDQNFCRLEELVSWVMELLDQFEQSMKKKVLFAVNITDRPDKLLERADKVINLGANCLMIDVICSGLTAVQTLREDPSIRVPIYCHRAGHAAFTRSKDHGISWTVYCKLVRMLGGDVLHAGTIVGKMAGNDELLNYKALRDDWFGFKPTMPAASGGLHPRLVPELVRYFGGDFMMNFGGGLHGHPSGTRAGAIAARQAVEAAMRTVGVDEYAKEHAELRTALKKWK